MPKEFTYHQRKTTDSYRKGWEKAFGDKEGVIGKTCMGEPVHDMVFRTRAGIKEETTEQKQPNE